MQSITLAGTSITSSRLGFGTAGLMRVPARQRETLLWAAWDAGIRHFDTAPIYGLGESERLLGRLLRGRSAPFTVTTKFGLRVSPLTERLLPLQSLGRSLLRAVPALRQRVRRRAANLYEKPVFTAQAARQSLERSLAALDLDRIDCFLAHDCAPEQLRDDALLSTLLELRERGHIACFGTATNPSATRQILDAHPHYCGVLQFALAAHESVPPGLSHAHGVITHGVMAGGFARLRQSADLRERWVQALEMDLSTPGLQAALFLRAALAANPTGIVLFESTSAQHIVGNATAAQQPLEPERLRIVQRLAAALEVDRLSVAVP